MYLVISLLQTVTKNPFPFRDFRETYSINSRSFQWTLKTFLGPIVMIKLPTLIWPTTFFTSFRPYQVLNFTLGIRLWKIATLAENPGKAPPVVNLENRRLAWNAARICTVVLTADFSTRLPLNAPAEPPNPFGTRTAETVARNSKWAGPSSVKGKRQTTTCRKNGMTYSNSST